MIVVGVADDDTLPGLRPEIYARTLVLANGDVVNLRTGQTLTQAQAKAASQAARAASGAESGARERQVNRPTPAPVTPIADVRRGQRVTLEGEVFRIRDEDEFILRDETGRIRVYIGWRNDMQVDVGDRVTVHGIADDDVLPFMRPEIYAQRLVLSDGSEINLRAGQTSRTYR